VKEQQERATDEARVSRRIMTANQSIAAEKGAKAELQLLLADAQHTTAQLEQTLKLKTSQLMVNTQTIRQTHLQYSRVEETKNADVYQKYIESGMPGEIIRAVGGSAYFLCELESFGVYIWQTRMQYSRIEEMKNAGFFENSTLSRGCRMK